MKSALLKFKIGLAAISVFTIGLVVYVLSQAGATKQDTATYDTANYIATKLGTYVNNQGTIPSSLHAAGIFGAPSTITYAKLSETSYKFCVIYKAASDSFNGTSIEDTIITAEDPALATSGNDSSSGLNDVLIIPNAHKKGANCQTITPELFNGGFGEDNGGAFNDNNSFDNGTGSTQFIDPTLQD